MQPAKHRFEFREILGAFTPVLVAGTLFLVVANTHPALLNIYGWVFPYAVGIVTALTALGGGIIFTSNTIRANARNAMVKAAFDSLQRKIWDKDYISARTIFLDVLEEGDLSKYALYAEGDTVESKNHNTKRAALRNIANDHELTAIGIKLDVMDEDVIKLWHKTAIIAEFKALETFIIASRKVAGAGLYIEIAEMVARWEDDDREKPADATSKRAA